MDANTVIAICSVVIAVASLGVSAYVAWATRKHNQLSVQPVLGFGTMFRAGGTAGLRLVNSGLGPARIISSQLWLGDEKFGQFNQPNVDAFRDRLKREGLPVRPHATTLGEKPFLPADYREFLLSFDHYDPSRHGEFARLIQDQLRLEIQYESIYGQRVTVFYPSPERASLLPAEDNP